MLVLFMDYIWKPKLDPNEPSIKKKKPATRDAHIRNKQKESMSHKLQKKKDQHYKPLTMALKPEP